MNELINNGSKEQTMSSKDIVILLNEGKPVEQRVRHDNVKRTMERLADREVISFTPMEEMIEVGKGAKREISVYHVTEDHSYIVVAQLSPEFTAALVKEWRRLKGENEELKMMVVAQGKKIDQLTELILNKLPAVEFKTDVPEVTPKKKGSKAGRRHLNDEDIKTIFALKGRGKTQYTIVNETGFSLSSVQRVLRGDRDHLLK